MIKKEKIEKIPINVSSRILRHVGRGMYRTPAGALKELITNAYDAGATKVTINTGFPEIEKIIVTDNGKGMTKQEFTQIINQIGFSNKRLGDSVKTEDNKIRKTVGHFGIGFLAISQLTKKATITSKAKGTLTGIKVEMDFNQFEESEEDGISRSIAKEEEELERKDNPRKGEVKIGECDLQILNYEIKYKNSQFTKIELNSIRKEVLGDLVNDDVRNLFGDIQKENKSYSAKFEDILRLIREKEVINTNPLRLRDYSYENLLWELSVYSPVEYPQYPIFKTGVLKYFERLVKKQDFRLVIDGFQIKKPYEKDFWTDHNFPLKIFKWTGKTYINTKNVKRKVSAYIAYRAGTMIRPKLLQGILVRENGIAVGLYDSTFLKYPLNEGTKFNSLTGEIFAEGLSGSMNIDRDSFNQTGEEYVKLKEWLHGKLYNEVFPYIKRYQKQKNSPTKEKNKNLLVDVLNIVAKENNKTINTVKYKSLGTSNQRIEKKGRILYINSDHRDCDLSTAKREKLILAVTLILHKYISISELEDILDEIQDIKKEIKS